jgi:hypothetical protein
MGGARVPVRQQTEIKIVPLFYRECDLPLNFMNLNYIDVQGRNYDLNYAKILDALSDKPVPSDEPASRPRTLEDRMDSRRNFIGCRVRLYGICPILSTGPSASNSDRNDDACQDADPFARTGHSDRLTGCRRGMDRIQFLDGRQSRHLHDRCEWREFDPVDEQPRP